jgi:hypothetical protein
MDLDPMYIHLATNIHHIGTCLVVRMRDSCCGYSFFDYSLLEKRARTEFYSRSSSLFYVSEIQSTKLSQVIIHCFFNNLTLSKVVFSNMDSSIPYLLCYWYPFAQQCVHFSTILLVHQLGTFLLYSFLD